MSRRPPDPIEDLLKALEVVLDRRPTDSHERLFRQYLDLFLRWNQVHRMTALDSATAIVRDLFIDSLLFLKVLPQRRPLAVVDIGAGAGIPGLPMRLADPTLKLCLVESRRKRVSFLRTVCRDLTLADVSVVEGRAEQIVQDDPTLSEVFDVAVSRAVGRIDRLSHVALPYLRPGGALIVSASPHGHRSAGVDLVAVPTPATAGSRRFLTIKK